MSEASDNIDKRDDPTVDESKSVASTDPDSTVDESKSVASTDPDSTVDESKLVASTEPEQWRVMFQTVQGASHIRKKLPNQDWGAFQQQNTNGLPIILAISDGHGSPKSFRSDRGSKLAVEIAITLLNGLVDQESDRDNLAAVKDYVEEKLKKTLVSKWKEAVNAHLEKDKFTVEEWDRLEQEKGRKSCQEVEENNFLAYGATLLAVLVTEDYNLYLQLGDGDILCVDTYGDITRPIRKDETLIANETYSLCMSDAWRYIEHRFVQYSKDKENCPMILVATDGYANSFEEKNFMKIGRDYLEMIRKEGCDEVEKQLKDILKQTSHGGSGDDITFGLIKRLDYKDTADKLQNIESVLKKLLGQVQLMQEGLKDSVKKNDVQEFVNLLTQISEASYSHLEKAVRAYTSSQQEWERRFVETTKAQYHKFEDLEQRLENLAEEESQNLKSIREEQQTQITKLKDNDDLSNQINWLKKGLIATIFLVVLSMGVNNIFWLIPKSSNINNTPKKTQLP